MTWQIRQREAELLGEKRGIAIGEERGIAIGEKRGEKRGEERGEKRGEMQKALAIARRMLEMGCSEELIIAATMLTKQEVEELSRTIKS